MLYLLGITYRDVPIEVRESVAFDRKQCHRLLARLMAVEAIEEAVVLSTCNRTEIVMGTAGESAPRGQVLEALRQTGGGEADLDHSLLTEYRGREVVEHLFRVAAGLESMVLGEDQILSQLRQAYVQAVDAESVSASLHRVFHQAFRVGKRSRHETGIRVGATSVGAVAAELVRSRFADPEALRVLLIGAGDIALAALVSLQKIGVSGVVVANRTPSRARELAGRLGGEAIPLTALDAALRRADVIVSATGAGTMLDCDRLSRAASDGRDRLRLVIDLGVPRDVDPAAERLPGIELYDVDGLRMTAEANARSREAEIPRVEEIVETETDQLMSRLRTADVLPTIKALHQHLDDLRRREVARYRHYFAEEDWEDLDAFSRCLVNKILHAPLARLHMCKDFSEVCGRCTIREVFGLETDE